VCPSVGIVIELREVDELIDGARVTLEVTDKLLVLAASLERRKPDLLIKLYGLGHLADMKRVGSKLVECHGGILLSVDARRITGVSYRPAFYQPLQLDSQSVKPTVDLRQAQTRKKIGRAALGCRH
jgi:hypothetical protein